MKILFTLICILSFLIVRVTLLRIGAFNLKVFGKKKSTNVAVMKSIVKIIRRYDIILLQEIRDSSGESINALESNVNRGSTIKYDKIVSARLGDTNSKEQYAYFYRKDDRIELIDSYVYNDINNDFEREPFIAKFKASHTVASVFVLAGIHIKPSEAIHELEALDSVRKDIVSQMTNENILFLGDMNAECRYASKKRLNALYIRNSPEYHWLIGDETDTTVSTTTDCAYDRFISYGEKFLASIKKGSCGIFEFDKEYGLSNTEALAVSDHYPIELELKTLPSYTTTAPTYQGKDTGSTSYIPDTPPPSNTPIQVITEILTNSTFAPYTMFTTVCIGLVICSCFYCVRG